jgi:hypothetical protein
MEQIKLAMKQMINVSDIELNKFLSGAAIKTFKRQEILSRPDTVPDEIFFI